MTCPGCGVVLDTHTGSKLKDDDKGLPQVCCSECGKEEEEVGD